MRKIVLFASLLAAAAASHAAPKMKDFAGSTCDAAKAAKVSKIEPFAGGQSAVYAVDTSAASDTLGPMLMKTDWVKKHVKVGDKACRATFVDED